MTENRGFGEGGGTKGKTKNLRAACFLAKGAQKGMKKRGQRTQGVPHLYDDGSPQVEPETNVGFGCGGLCLGCFRRSASLSRGNDDWFGRAWGWR